MINLQLQVYKKNYLKYFCTKDYAMMIRFYNLINEQLDKAKDQLKIQSNVIISTSNLLDSQNNYIIKKMVLKK